MIPTGVEQRLRAHVAQVLAYAHVPERDRDGVAEELYGHLVERWRAFTDGGMEPARAADEAVRSFGAARHIGSDLTRSFRGRFWASTIGVLLPVATVRGPRPRIAWWLGASLAVYAVLGGFHALAVAANSSPLRAVVVSLLGLGTTAIYLLAATALARRQRWGLDVAIIANVIGLVTGWTMMLSTPGLISLNVVFSGALLLIAATERERLGRWVRRSASVDGALAVTILATLLGGAIAPAAAREIPDPTQSAAHDLHITASLTCAEREVAVSVELRWDRVALLPGGVANLRQYGDLLLLENSLDDAWEIAEYPLLVDVATGETVAEPDEGYRPNSARLEELEGGPSAIQIAWDALQPGHTYRTTWVLRKFDDPTADGTFGAAVEYLHADQFRWEQLVDCMGGRHEPFVSDWP